MWSFLKYWAFLKPSHPTTETYMPKPALIRYLRTSQSKLGSSALKPCSCWPCKWPRFKAEDCMLCRELHLSTRNIGTARRQSEDLRDLQRLLWSWHERRFTINVNLFKRGQLVSLLGRVHWWHVNKSMHPNFWWLNENGNHVGWFEAGKIHKYLRFTFVHVLWFPTQCRLVKPLAPSDLFSLGQWYNAAHCMETHVP